MRRILLIGVGLAFGSYVVWDRLEARWLSQDVAAIAARGEPTALDAGLPEPKTQQQRDVADLYAQAALAALESDDNGRAGRLDVDKSGGTELSLEDIRANYPDNAPALQLVDRATPLDFGGFTPEQREGDSYQTSGLERGLSTLAAVACLRADLASLSGDGDAAARALVPCIGVKRTVTLAQNRAGIADRILGSVRILFRHTTPSDGALADLQRAMASWPDEDNTVGDMMRDRARLLELSGTAMYPGVVYAIGRVFFHPFALRSKRRAIDRFVPAIAFMQRPWSERWPTIAEAQRARAQRWQQHPPSTLDRLENPFELVTPESSYLLTSAAREIAARRLIVTVLATERDRRAHGGAVPVSITAADDPFSGRPLIYKQEAGGYVIYSVDVNRKDDGGSLYGFGAAGLRPIGQQPRDYGIRVPLKAESR